MSRNLIIVLYYSITLLCVIISGVLSYQGFEKSFPNAFLTVLFVLVIVFGLFGADSVFQLRRSRGESLAGPFVLLLFFSFFSTSSNFNAIYTQFMERDAGITVLNDQLIIFRDDLNETRKAIEEYSLVSAEIDRKTEIDRELARLRDQVSDPARPGCGVRCAEHVRNIESLLGKPLTDIARPGADASRPVIQGWYARMEEAVRSDYEDYLSDKVSGRLLIRISEIDAHLREYNTSAESLYERSKLVGLQEMALISAEVARKVNVDLPDDLKITHTSIDITLGRLGEIAYSFRNAFGSMPNPIATFLSLLIGAVVDFFPIAFAMVAFNARSGGAQIGPSRRKGRAGRVFD